MKLSVIERITLMQILPKEGSHITFKILIELKSALSFNEKEIREFGMTEGDGRLHWKKSVDKEIPIGEKATDIIVSTLKKLDETHKLSEQTNHLYGRFIENDKT